MTPGQVIRPLLGVGNKLLGSSPGSTGAEFEDSILLDGEFSVALGKALAKYTRWLQDPFGADHRRNTLTTSPMFRNLRSERYHYSNILSSARGSDALWKNQIVDRDSKTRRWRSDKSVRRYEKHARLLKETSKLSRATRKVWTAHDQTHVEVPRRLFASSSSSGVENSGPQSLMIPEARCRATLRGIFKVAQRQSKDGRFFLLLSSYACRQLNRTSLVIGRGHFERKICA